MLVELPRLMLPIVPVEKARLWDERPSCEPVQPFRKLTRKVSVR
jgi:hypothetical protein